MPAQPNSLDQGRREQRAALLTLAAAMLFNFLLCFVNTKITGVRETHVILAELAVLGAAALLCMSRVASPLVMAAAIFAGYLMMIAIFSGQLDAKLYRDLAIPLIFLFLGASVQSAGSIKRVAMAAAAVVLAVSLVEYAALDQYLSFFDIKSFYIAKGALDPSIDEASSAAGLFASGIRPEGRGLLPFLGDHRVSSIFLEPVSMGNFGALLALCGMALVRTQRAAAISLTLAGLIVVVLADSRFGVAMILLIIILRMVPVAWDWRAVSLMLPATIAGLLLVPSLISRRIWGNDITDRLYHSGALLRNLDPWQWLGFVQPQRLSNDAGFVYLITKIGIVGVAALWLAFLMIPTRDADARFYRAGLAVYLCASLAISGSIFTIKTGAFAWFLLGAFVASAAAPRAAMPPARPVTWS
jgi:putative polymerase